MKKVMMFILFILLILFSYSVNARTINYVGNLNVSQNITGAYFCSWDGTCGVVSDFLAAAGTSKTAVGPELSNTTTTIYLNETWYNENVTAYINYLSTGGNISFNESYTNGLYLGIDDQRYNDTLLIISVNDSWKSNATAQLILIDANSGAVISVNNSWKSNASEQLILIENNEAVILANNNTININLTAIWNNFANYLLSTEIYAILSGNMSNAYENDSRIEGLINNTFDEDYTNNLYSNQSLNNLTPIGIVSDVITLQACPDTQVYAYNLTKGAWQCEAKTSGGGGGTVTSVSGDGEYVLGTITSVGSFTFNETKLIETIESESTNEAYVNGVVSGNATDTLSTAYDNDTYEHSTLRSERNTLITGNASLGYVNDSRIEDKFDNIIIGINNLSFADIVANIGNWSDDKGDYYTSTETDNIIIGINNLSFDDIAGNIGNWSADSGDYYTSVQTDNIIVGINNLSYSDIEGNIGNWSDDKSDYFTSTQVDNIVVGINNLSFSDIEANIGNWSADSSDYYTSSEVDNIVVGINNLSFSDIEGNIGNWSDDKGSYYTSVIVNNIIAGINNLSYSDIESNIGNWSDDKSDYFTSTETDNIIIGINNLSLSDIESNLGNWSDDKSEYYTSTATDALFDDYIKNDTNVDFLNMTVSSNASFESNTYFEGCQVWSNGFSICPGS